MSPNTNFGTNSVMELDEGTTSSMHSSVDDDVFSVGILTESLKSIGAHTLSIPNPSSSCVISSMVLLGSDDTQETVQAWCTRNRLCGFGKPATAFFGEEYYQEMLESSSVDAVYVSLPFTKRKDFVSRALKAGKHVLVDYPVSGSVSEFMNVLELSRKCRKHIQDSTMFVHHHRVEEFLECVFDTENFGEIKNIHTTLIVPNSVLDPVTMKTHPEWQRQGACIAMLARFCIMFGLIVFDSMELKVKSIQATKAQADENGSIQEVVCKIDFEKERSLIIDCGTTISRTRQLVEVESASKSASMINFVYPQASIASYRLYERSTTKEVVSGDSIDIEGGPPQAAMMWRRFAEKSQLTDDSEAKVLKGDRITVDTPREYAHVMVETVNIINGLMQSIENGGEEITLEPVEILTW